MECKAMVPDSTQSETVPDVPSRPPTSCRAPSGSTTKKKMNETSKTKKNKRKSVDKTSQTSKKKKLSKEKSHKEQKKKSKKAQLNVKKSDPAEPDSDVDLENDVKPIRDYIKNRDLMLQHMFKSVIKANKLQAMLPEILKGLAMEDLKRLCLIQLEGMSKPRIASILAGEEMQSSSEEEESDSDTEKVFPKRDDTKDVINSEVIDSTSVLPHASPCTVDVGESMSVHEEAAGEEANEGESDDENVAECGEEEAVSADESWQNENNRDDVEEKMECRQDEEVDEPDAEPNEEEEEEEIGEGGDIQEVELVVEIKKPKKFRRIKIVPTEGEEFEEGELTSDEVETDEESVLSTKEEMEELSRPEGEEQMDEDQETDHGAALSVEDELRPEPDKSLPKSTPKRSVDSLDNPGNQVIKDNDNDTDDNDDAIDSVLIKTNTEKDVTSDDTLNVLAEEDNFDIDAKESCNLVETADSVNDSDRDAGTNDSEDNVSVNDEVDNDVKSENDGDNNIVDGLNANETDKSVDIVANQGKVQEPPQPPQRSQGASGGTTSAKSGRKVAQELEVLELELRARAIRSLMKQYGKDVG